MSESQDNSPDRLERLLRTWGAEQAVAAEEANLGNPPVPAPARLPWLTRFAPLLLAAGLLLAAAGVVLFVASLNRPAGQADRSAAAPASRPDDPLPRIRQLNDQLAADLADAQHALALARQAEAQAARDARDLARQLADRDAALAERDRAVRHAETQRDASAARLADAGAAAARLRQELAALKDASAKASAELDQRRRQIDQLDAQLRDRRLAALLAFQAVYLAAPDSVAARQRAMRAHRLIERQAEVRKSIRDEGPARLADVLEVWLTRLDQLDANDARGVSELVGQLAALKLPEKIEAALAALAALAAADQAALTAEARSWLLECELVFLRLGQAG